MAAIHILLVEDNEGDIFLTREAFREANIVSSLSVVRDGKEALDFLTRQGKHTHVEMPDLLLLDVNLPKMNGHEVLHFIKADLNLKHIPVIMLTTSSSPTDVNLAYNNYANCFITKPMDVNDFIRVIATIGNFWISTVKLPAQN